MISPSQMLGIPKFAEWYPGQEYIFQQLVAWMNSSNRFACCPIPTGFGKSLLGILTAWWGSTRTAYVTSTKGLQDQLMDDFQTLHLREIKGRGSYVCDEYPTFFTDAAPCTYGVSCSARDTCQYFSRLDRARDAQLVSTNYSYWLHQHGHSDGISHSPSAIPPETGGNPFGLLILDEGHTAAQWIESYMRVELDSRELDRFSSPNPTSWDKWRAEAARLVYGLREEEKELKDRMLGYGGAPPGKLRSDHKWIRILLGKVENVAAARGEWVPEEDGDGGMIFTPLDVREHNQTLFMQVPKILIMSAVMTPRAAEELGVLGPTWIQPSSPFDPANSPFTHIRTARVDFRWTGEMKKRWVAQIDNILRTRRDRKGIIHTGSYERAQIILANSRYRDQILTHTSRTTSKVVQEFKRSKAGTILVSPSITTGYDFPGEECEFIVWGKVPYPYTNTVLAKARKKIDATYADWEAMKTLVQGAGRGNRKEDDRCEVFIVDDHWAHFWKYHSDFAPGWFRERVQGSVDLIPPPLEKLNGSV
jgi:ATP-dependent DNA helicase DinG